MLNVAELDERIEKCLAILAENPHSRVFAALAEAYRKRGDFGKAFSTCKGGLKHHPQYAPAHIVMAKLYMHQRMYTEALASLDRAVQSDSPTRITDQLEAEIRLSMGDLNGASPIIARLKMSDPNNPQVMELDAHIKSIRASEPRDQAHSTQPAQSPPPAPSAAKEAPMPAQPVSTEPITWEQWEQTLASVPHVNAAFVWDADGDPLAGVHDREHDASGGTAAVDLFRTVQSLLREKTNASLQELRVESSTGEVWCGRHSDCVIGFVGDQSVSFGAVRQTAFANARRTDARK